MYFYIHGNKITGMYIFFLYHDDRENTDICNFKHQLRFPSLNFTVVKFESDMDGRFLFVDLLIDSIP